MKWKNLNEINTKHRKAGKKKRLDQNVLGGHNRETGFVWRGLY